MLVRRGLEERSQQLRQRPPGCLRRRTEQALGSLGVLAASQSRKGLSQREPLEIDLSEAAVGDGDREVDAPVVHPDAFPVRLGQRRQPLLELLLRGTPEDAA